MPLTSFRQSDLERIFRAAKKMGLPVEIDLKTMIVTVRPAGAEDADAIRGQAPDGNENWDD